MSPTEPEIDQDTPLDTDPPLNSQSESTTYADEPYTSESSVLKATKEQHSKAIREKGKGGSGTGNNKTGMSNTLVKKEIPIPIPTPRFTVFKSDASNPNQTSKRFYAYWNELPTWGKDRLLMYVYREWPVLVQPKEDSEEFKYIDKISGNEPLQDDVDLLNRYGSGSYKLMFGEPSKANLCTVYVSNLGVNDLKSHPPADRRISDVSQVEMSYPGNKSYIEYLRTVGKLPEQTKGKELEAEMAVTSLVDRLQDRNEKLTDRALEMAKAGATKSVEPTQEAIDRAIGVVADAATRSNEMLSEAYQTIKQTKAEGNTSATEMLKLAFELAEKLSSKGSGDSDEIRELRAELARVQSDRVASLEKMMAEMRAAPASVTPGSSPFAHIKEGFAAIKEMRELVDDMGGGKQDATSDAIAGAANAAGLPGWATSLIQYGLPILGNVVSGVMVSRGLATPGPLQQAPPMPMPPGMGGMPNPMAPQQARPMPQAGPVPIPPPPGIPAPQAQAMPTPGVSQYGLPPDVEDLLYEIKTPFTFYLSNGDMTGEDYADIFIGNYGEEMFKQVAGFGAEGLMGAITSFPPITQRLVALSINQERVSKFVGEFCGFVPGQEEGDGEDETPAPITPINGGGAA